MRGLICVLVALAVSVSAQQLVAKKEFVSHANGLYTIRVSYRQGSEGVVSDVSIKDSLPDYLELASGNLNAKGPNPTNDGFSNDYQVRVVDWEFSLANRTKDLMLPGASIQFTKEDGSDGTVKTGPLRLSVTGPVIFGGPIDQPILVFALTILVPLFAAYFGIAFFHKADSTTSSKKKKN